MLTKAFNASLLVFPVPLAYELNLSRALLLRCKAVLYLLSLSVNDWTVIAPFRLIRRLLLDLGVPAAACSYILALA